MEETLKMKRIAAMSRSLCVYCGAAPEPPDMLLEGKKGGICRGCVYALAARLAETERETGEPGESTGMISLSPEAPTVGDGRSAHDYQTRMDLANAYVEMGRKNAAVNELLTAAESALHCNDFKTALRSVARARKIADGPNLRDRIADIFTRNAPPEDE